MLLTLVAAFAAPLVPVSAEASRSEAATADLPYESASALYDRKFSTVWAEGEAEGSGLGDWVKFDLGGEKNVTSFRLWNGCWWDYDLWTRHNRIKEVEVEFSDGSKQTFTLKDEKASQVITLPKAVKTSSVKFKIKSVYRGSTFNVTALSEVVIFDDSPDKSVPAVGYKASSVYPEDADSNYNPENVSDLLGESMWCEGDAGDGTGQWLEVDFGGSKSVSQLSLVNGNAASPVLFMKSNRATEAELTFSDGSKQKVVIKNSFSPQIVTFSPVTTSKVRITFTVVSKGKEFNDLCVSEAAFLP